MKPTARSTVPRRRVSALALLFSSALLAGCSQELASFDDGYAPTAPEERFPISVADQPVRLEIPAGTRALSVADFTHLTSFARAAANSESAAVTISYAGGDKTSRAIASQVSGVLQREGVVRSRIAYAPEKGRSGPVTVSFLAKTAVVASCGDFSRNLSGNLNNELPPNYGCAIQNNLAAMVANPQDIAQPQALTPLNGAARSAALKKYYDGDWTDAGTTAQSSSTGN